MCDRDLGGCLGLILGEAVQKILLVITGKFIIRGHVQAVRGARISTKIAITAKRHVDVKLGDAQFNGGPVGSKNRWFLFSPFLRDHPDAIDRADAHTLSATDAIFNFIKKAHPAALRQCHSLVGVLKCHRGCKKMHQGDLHPDQDGPNGTKDISKILNHIFHHSGFTNDTPAEAASQMRYARANASAGKGAFYKDPIIDDKSVTSMPPSQRPPTPAERRKATRPSSRHASTGRLATGAKSIEATFEPVPKNRL